MELSRWSTLRHYASSTYTSLNGSSSTRRSIGPGSISKRILISSIEGAGLNLYDDSSVYPGAPDSDMALNVAHASALEFLRAHQSRYRLAEAVVAEAVERG